MQKLREMLEQGPTFSFEFFPPKTDKGRENLRQAISELESLQPSFVSVTYGAGGSTRGTTKEIVSEINETTPLTPVPHLTCIAHTRSELRGILAGYHEEGLRTVLALHGDPPRDNPDIEPGELERAVELVRLAREVGDFSVAVAAHPEGHPNAPDMATDRKHQAAKLKEADAGITQFFFDPQHYFRFMDDLERLGVDTPIIAGVIPVTNAKQVQKFAAMSGAEFPTKLAERLEAAGDDPDEVRRIGVEAATETTQQLLDQGVPGIHFYTLNRAQAVCEVYEHLGIPAGARA